MGSRSKIDLAYIAGFLDGDGSLMLQIKKRSDSKIGLRFMLTICFYQDSRHESNLFWIKEVLSAGYLSRRNDGMSELRINGIRTIKEILNSLKPHLRFKKHQAEAMFQAAAIMENKTFKNLTKSELRKIVKYMQIIQFHNYASAGKKTKQELTKILGLTP